VSPGVRFASLRRRGPQARAQAGTCHTEGTKLRHREEVGDGRQDARNPSPRSTGHVAKEVKKGIKSTKKGTKKVEPALQKTLRAIPAGRYKGPAPCKKGKDGIVVGEDHKGTGPHSP
jgi:hypothetical protein